VVRGVLIPVNLETSYLHVKTNSAVGSSDMIWIQYRDNKRRAGGIVIWFTAPRVSYSLLNCMRYSFYPFLTTLPTELEKQWTIEKRGYKTRVFCNKVLVADITVSNMTCKNSNWEYFWRWEVSGILYKSKSVLSKQVDDASEAYRIG
jgi:hypothetical protein